MSKEKDIWESYASTDAYYAVSTFDKFRGRNIDGDSRSQFFDSGQRHISDLWHTLEQKFEVKLEPKMSLDYGCGVGRLLLPLAERSLTATGVDISPRMLDETRRNLAEKQLNNVTLQEPDEFFHADSDRYDLVHTYIVLQHINPKVGYRIIQKMADRLETGGHGMIHVTCTDPAGRFRRLRSKIYRDVPGVHRALNFVRGKTERQMPMYEYSSVRVHEILQASGCKDLFSEPTDHGMIGEMIFFRK